MKFKIPIISYIKMFSYCAKLSNSGPGMISLQKLLKTFTLFEMELSLNKIKWHCVKCETSLAGCGKCGQTLLCTVQMGGRLGSTEIAATASFNRGKISISLFLHAVNCGEGI